MGTRARASFIAAAGRAPGTWLGLAVVTLACVLLAAGWRLMPKTSDRNWVVLQVYDSAFPLTQEQTFPEALSAIEIINQLYAGRKAVRDLERKAGLLGRDGYGDRAREGHFMVWVHFSDAFLAQHPIDRRALGEKIFLFRDRSSDIFTAWSGDVNLAGFLTQGVKGFAEPVTDPVTGRPAGAFQSFAQAVAQGEADYEAGWYLSDEQAAKLLVALPRYPGIAKGYTFLSRVGEKPNAPYEPVGTEFVNGYNCGDFAFYLLTRAGVVTSGEAESLKVKFWYPEIYVDHPVPLLGVGAAGARWVNEHPGAQRIPDDTMMRLGWLELLAGPRGLEFFDKRAVVEQIEEEHTPLGFARIWDQAHVIEWLRKAADFRAKGVLTELAPAAARGEPISSPERTVPESPANRYLSSSDYAGQQRIGRVLYRLKLRAAGLEGAAGERFRALYEHLKSAALALRARPVGRPARAVAGKRK